MIRWILILLLGVACHLGAEDRLEDELSSFSLENSHVAGASMLSGVGNTANQIAVILTGPVLYICMGVGILLALYGIGAFGHLQGSGSGSYKYTITGIFTFVLAAAMKGFFVLLIKKT